MTQTMIERMARAIAEAQDYYQQTDDADDVWRTYIPHARAALSALLEPTEAMVEVGLDWLPDCSQPHMEGYEPTADDAIRVFAAMIQAAQTEGETL